MSKRTVGSSSQKPTSSKAQDTAYPAPFDKAPAAIEPFLPQLDPSKIYITHIDRHKPDFKKQIFLFAVLVNSTVTALLFWRTYIAAPKYLALILTFLGFRSSATVDTASTTRRQQVMILLRRTAMMVFDFALFRFIGPWPMTFFLERPANPVTWRWKVRFQPQEMVVRVCRNWTAVDLMEGTKKGGESPFFKTRILPATDGKFMEKTAYLMMDGSWDLDFGLMQDAHVLLKEEKLNADDLDRYVLVHQDRGGWLAWKFGSDIVTTDVGLEFRKAMEEAESASEVDGKSSR